MSSRRKTIESFMNGVPTRHEVKVQIDAAIAAYDKTRSPAAIWLAPIRWVGALIRDGAYTFAGFFAYCWDRITGTLRRDEV